MRYLSFAFAGLLVAVLVALVGMYRAGLLGDDGPDGSVRELVHHGLEAPLQTFRKHVGRYPLSEEGLAALFAAPPGTEDVWRGPYVADSDVLEDPWGRALQYRFPRVRSTAAYDIWSLGADGVGSEDDIGNWE